MPTKDNTKEEKRKSKRRVENTKLFRVDPEPDIIMFGGFGSHDQDNPQKEKRRSSQHQKSRNEH